MWLEAVLSKADIETVLRQFSPLTIRLGDGGSLVLVGPAAVSFIPDPGIGVTCDATVYWPVLGFDVPVALRGLTVRVFPVVETAAEGSRLVFRLHVDHAGVSMLPAMFDQRATARINEELEKQHVELSWAFTRSLTHEFRLPGAMQSAASISLVAIGGTVKTNDGALGLAVKFETSVKRR